MGKKLFPQKNLMTRFNDGVLNLRVHQLLFSAFQGIITRFNREFFKFI